MFDENVHDSPREEPPDVLIGLALVDADAHGDPERHGRAGSSATVGGVSSLGSKAPAFADTRNARRPQCAIPPCHSAPAI